jgi:uncharacterized membrane protein
MNSNHKPVVRAGIFLGIGMGGFVDGIVFHQLLQTHGMLSATLPKTTIPNIEINMFWDGLFHTLTWIMTAIGLRLLWTAGRQRDVAWSGKALMAAMFLGWGLFNFVEGLVDHFILNIHHVVQRLGLSAFDYAYLASGILLMVLGSAAIRSLRDSHSPNSATET